MFSEKDKKNGEGRCAAVITGQLRGQAGLRKRVAAFLVLIQIGTLSNTAAVELA